MKVACFCRERFWPPVGAQRSRKHEWGKWSDDLQQQEGRQGRHSNCNWSCEPHSVSPLGWSYTVHCQHTSLSSVRSVSQIEAQVWYIFTAMNLCFDSRFTCPNPHFVSFSDNLYNTNRDFDWGAFRQLKEELTLSWTPPSFFLVVFSQPGVYVFSLSSNQHKHLVTTF